MTTVSISTPAPDFSLDDRSGQPVLLSSFQNSRNVVLVFNRGFM